MKIEILFPEVCNIYGDHGNILYLEKTFLDSEFYYTSLVDEPKFISENIDFVYMGSMTEKSQEKVIKKLMPYREILKRQIEDGKAFLFTGNSFEILGNYIEEDEKKIEGLGIIDFYSKREMFNRYSGSILGKFEDIDIVGFKNQFAHQYGNNTENYFVNVTRGIGINRNSKLEGYRINNFIGTSILGPILVLNPILTRYIFENILNFKDIKLPYEEEALEAYNIRLKEFCDMKRKIG